MDNILFITDKAQTEAVCTLEVGLQTIYNVYRPFIMFTDHL